MDRFQELDEDVSYRSMREYAGASAFLPIKIRRVPEEERRGLMSRIVIESAMTKHPVLRRWQSSLREGLVRAT